MNSHVGHAALAAVFALGVACGDSPPAQGADTAPSADAAAPAEAARLQATPQSLPPGRPVVPQAPADEVDISALGVDRGTPGAPVQVVEFSDYGCGYCRKFHEETWPVLARDFVDAGKVEWKFLPFVSGMFENSTHALAAAECALEQGGDAFEDMNGRIWDGQRTWKQSSDAAAVLHGFAEEAGLDMDRYDTCVAQGRRNRRITAANQLARQLGVRGTPTFFVVGYPPIQGALPTETFQKVMELVYEEATKGGAN